METKKKLLKIQTNVLLSVHRRYNFILDEFIKDAGAS